MAGSIRQRRNEEPPSDLIEGEALAIGCYGDAHLSEVVVVFVEQPVLADGSDGCRRLVF